MAKKKEPTPEKQVEELRQQLIKTHKRWHDLYENGGSDPTWADGSGLNLYRNRICYYTEQIKELCAKNNLPIPKECSLPKPKEVPKDYMVKPDEIREKAKASLARYKADPNYQYLLAESGKLDDKTADRLCVKAVLHYVTGLQLYIEQDDLVRMRCHKNGDIYVDSFRRCAEGTKNALAEAEKAAREAPFVPVQLSLFG